MDCARHAGSIHQHLQDGALLIVDRYDNDRKLGHNLNPVASIQLPVATQVQF
jgi:hypothetical protein